MERFARKILLFPLLLALTLCLLLCAMTLSASAEESDAALQLTLQGSDGEATDALTLPYGNSLTATVALTGVAQPETQTLTLTLGKETYTLTPDATGKATLTLEALRLPTAGYTVTAACDSLSASASLTVIPRTVTLDGMTVADKIYDGSTVAEVTTYGTLIGVLEGDDISLNTANAVCSFADQDVGQNKAVALYLATLQGSARRNYSFEAPVLTASILPRKVTLTNVVITPFTYNGKTDVTVESYTLSGILESETDAAYLAGIGAIALSPNASPAQAVAFDPEVTHLTGHLATNYELILPTDVTVAISPATLTLSVEKVTINKGQPLPALAARVEGFVSGESADSLTGFLLPTVTPEAVNTLNTALTAVNVTFEGGNATGNYVFDRETHATVALEIRTVTATDADFTVSVEDLSLWHNTALTVTPAGDYVGMTTDNTDSSIPLEDITFASLLTLNSEGTCTVTFALRHADGSVTEPVTLSYKLDTVAPTGNVLWREQSILTGSTPTYRYFSKSPFVLTLTADDGSLGSGIAKLEYATAADGPFAELTGDDLTLTEVGLHGVWYRITDTAGNVTLLCTDGLVLYTDATASDTALSFERLSKVDPVLSLTLNGNGVAAFCDGNGLPLTDEAFAVDDDGLLTLKATYLATLPAGSHTFTLSFDPLGLPFVENSTNDAPAKLTISLTVSRRAPTAADFTVTPPSSTVYDGTAKSATVLAPTGMGTVTVYYLDSNGNRLTAVQNAGTYTVCVNTATGEDYTESAGLAIGMLVITKMTPAAPNVTYNAATGLLSGDTDGLLFAKNGNNFAPLPTDLILSVNSICTLRFYLPGDGLNTEDSEVAHIEITRAAPPTVVPVDETLFAACDGKLYATVDGMEYRHVGETAWIAATGTVITSLAPGSYEVRIAALGTALESSAVTVTVKAAPEFLLLQRESETADLAPVTVKGQLTALATLQLQGLTADPNAASPLLSLSVIDQRTTEVIRFFTPTLNGRHQGTLTLVIAVDEAYNGRTLTIYRENANGSVESLQALCENGRITLETDSLSPILIAAPMTTPHGTGSTAWIFVLAVLGILAIAFCVIMEIVVHKRKKKEKSK